MKLNKIFHIIIFLLFANIAAANTIEITPNTVYRLKNHKGQYLTSSNGNAITAALDNSNLQEWYIEPNNEQNGFYVRNVTNGAYLKSSLVRSQGWTVVLTGSPVPENMLMSFTDVNGEVAFRAITQTSDNTYMYAHSDGGNNVVCWTYSGSDNSKWTLEQVNKTEEELTKIRQNFAKITGALSSREELDQHLETLFSDKARTKLKEGINLEGNEDYEALPDVLQKMVLKFKENTSDSWKESYTYKDKEYQWDGKYAKKYRVQWYEPYSEGAGAASLAAIQYHTNMNNPTGILADAGDIIYVMVDENPRSGATLYLGEVLEGNMNNETTKGTELKAGLNVVPCFNDNAHLFIYYTVTTTQVTNGVRVPIEANKLSNFAPIKIHIEGGRLNGFYDAQGDDPRVDTKDEFYYAPDSKEDIKYTLARATHPMYDMLGRYQILHLHKENTTYTDPQSGFVTNGTGVRNVYLGPEKSGGVYDPAETMKAWDNICFAQRILMGLQSAEEIEDEFNRGYYSDIVGKGFSKQCGNNTYKADPGFHFSDYFNNRHFALSGLGSAELSMNATNWRTYMNSERIEDVLINLPKGTTANIFHVSHEYGHLNQQPIKIAGTTETSNNVFTLLSMHFFPNPSTYNRISNTNAIAGVFMRNRPLLETGDGVIRFLWQLWLYYHHNKNNTEFYPRLFELLRKNPIRYNQGAGGMHDEKYDWLNIYKMCCIAAEEDLTEFFESYGFFVPLDYYPIEDYSHYNATLSQKDINDAKRDVANMHLPKNLSIMFIDNNIGVLANNGTYGNPSSFIQKDQVPSNDYEFTIDNSTVKITPGEIKGVGYMVRSVEGNRLLSFANTDEFTLTPELLAELIQGTAKIYVVGPASQLVEVKNGLLESSVEDLFALLTQTFDIFKEYVNQYVDDTETKIGYLKESKVDEQLSDYQNKINALHTGNPNPNKITNLIAEILHRQESIKDDYSFHVEFEPGAAYMIRNGEYTSHFMSTDGRQVNNASYSQQFNRYWIIDTSDYDDNYTIYNMENEKYLYYTGVKNDANIPFKEEGTDKFKLIPVEGKVGLFNIAGGGDTNKCISNFRSIGNPLYYTDASLGAKTEWYLTKILDKEYFNLRDKIKQLNEEFYEEILMDSYWWNPWTQEKSDKWLEAWNTSEEITQNIGKPTTSKSQMQEYNDNLVQLYEELRAEIHGSTTVTLLSVGCNPDGVDNGYDENAMRMAFKSPKHYSSGMHNFDDSILLSADIQGKDIMVTVEPVDLTLWTMPKSGDLKSEYQKIFSTTAPEASLMEQLESLADENDENFYMNYFDGFYNEASGKLIETGHSENVNGETFYEYSLGLNVSCSGIYKVTLRSSSDDYVIFDTDKKVPSFMVEIYPNVNIVFEKDNGLNIEGYTFSPSDPEHDKTIYLPKDFVAKHNMKSCTVYIPGLYFANEFRVVNESDAIDSYSLIAPYASSSTTSNHGASTYYAKVDLSSLKDMEENSSPKKLNVSVSKNGASSNFTYYVAVGENGNVSTNVESIETIEGEEPVYYNLQGVRVINPQHGIYIRRIGNKAEKVIL